MIVSEATFGLADWQLDKGTQARPSVVIAFLNVTWRLYESMSVHSKFTKAHQMFAYLNDAAA